MLIDLLAYWLSVKEQMKCYMIYNTSVNVKPMFMALEMNGNLIQNKLY